MGRFSRLIFVLNMGLVAFLSPLSHSFAAGGIGTGGGFAYSRSSSVLLLESRDFAIAILRRFTAAGYAYIDGKFSDKNNISDLEWLKRVEVDDNRCLNEILAKRGLRPIVPKEMARIIYEVRSNYEGSQKRKNKEGILEPLDFDFGTDPNGTKYIVALKEYFDGYMSYNPDVGSMAMELRVPKLLIHEAAHHMGPEYRLDDDQAEALTLLLTDIRFQFEFQYACIK